MSCSLTVATWNLHSWVGCDSRRDPERTLRVINSLDAQVVALQEVRLPVMDAAEAGSECIADATGLRVVSGPTLLRSSGPYGNMLLSALPVDSVRRRDLSLPGREPRGVVEAVLRAPWGKVRAAAVHFGLSTKERLIQARHLLEFLDQGPALPLVLMGDFNEWRPGSPPLRLLARNLCVAPPRLSFPARCPLLALDRIYMRPAPTSVRVRGMAHSEARWASDHLPLKAEISWEPADQGEPGALS